MTSVSLLMAKHMKTMIVSSTLSMLNNVDTTSLFNILSHKHTSTTSTKTLIIKHMKSKQVTFSLLGMDKESFGVAIIPPGLTSSIYVGSMLTIYTLSAISLELYSSMHLTFNNKSTKHL